MNATDATKATIPYSPCVVCGVGGDPVGRIHLSHTEETRKQALLDEYRAEDLAAWKTHDDSIAAAKAIFDAAYAEARNEYRRIHDLAEAKYDLALRGIENTEGA
ncbi:hypothetical protein UFOVP978_46 [uncultured Caudovirales phage]|uniref:Uncharacterized protein n=1 Tax=uncultured Caudovirales phage TaxID=2100421 RepID=A0A6J5QAF2_9CAUD|nr:hypothetical protein UFOVP978_46 [uncultured Caudovirales phage]